MSNKKGREMNEQKQEVSIKPMNMKILKFALIGTAPLMQAAFTAKARLAIEAKHRAGSTAKNKKTREARDFEQQFKDAMHISEEGWVGIPAPAFRNACIAACRVADFKMTLAKMSIFILADGLDKVNGQPLVKLNPPQPNKAEMNMAAVRNASGILDLRARPMWRKWGCDLRVRYDADQFTANDVANLLERAGQQVGIGEGRPFSRESCGMDLGTFTIRSR